MFFFNLINRIKWIDRAPSELARRNALSPSGHLTLSNGPLYEVVSTRHTWGGRIDDACGVFTGHPYGRQQPLIFGWLVGWLVVPWVSVPVLMAFLKFAWVSVALICVSRGLLWGHLRPLWGSSGVIFGPCGCHLGLFGA